MDSSRLWDELDEVSEEIHAQFGDDEVFLADNSVRFVLAYNKKVPAGTKAIVLDRMGDYYALAVKGEYVEGVHASYLEKIDDEGGE